MRNYRRGPGALASAGVFCALAFATPATAQRTIQVDIPKSIPICSLGSTDCDGVYLGGGDPEAEGLPFANAYVYAQGAVSFDSRLSGGATAGDPGSLGGTWFAPGFDENANYLVTEAITYGDYSTPPIYLFSFYTQGANIFGDPDEPGANLDFPLFQIQIFSTQGYFDQTAVAFGYRLDPTPGALIGFNGDAVNNSNGLLVGPNAGDTDFITYIDRVPYQPPEYGYDDDDNLIQISDEIPAHYTAPTPFNALYGEVEPSGVPEPANWAMMIAGFGLVGSSLRARRSARRFGPA